LGNLVKLFKILRGGAGCMIELNSFRDERMAFRCAVEFGRRRDTYSAVAIEEARYAAGATLSASLRPSPPIGSMEKRCKRPDEDNRLRRSFFRQIF
jgi:hypothetical protein